MHRLDSTEYKYTPIGSVAKVEVYKDKIRLIFKTSFKIKMNDLVKINVPEFNNGLILKPDIIIGTSTTREVHLEIPWISSNSLMDPLDMVSDEVFVAHPII